MAAIFIHSWTLCKIMKANNLHVIETVNCIIDCATQPFLCRCDDDERYVVKGMLTCPRIRYNAQ
ncbi:HipA family kinase [Erwinia persicina]|uniref:HipA family kinase n=1 Tax=Erwinia persicina TaxID=55211 RepID=UPI00292A58D8|nr:HipA family kinase [Erwinia persicina]